tara:strand:+ start:195 stop:473 length:279 start_codon:yes stop_codon:yes gene_type:complete
MKKDNSLELISIILGLISTALAIYYSNNNLIQITFFAMLLIFAASFFIYDNSVKVKNSNKELIKINQKIENIEKTFNIYSRLAKLEHEVQRK